MNDRINITLVHSIFFKISFGIRNTKERFLEYGVRNFTQSRNKIRNIGLLDRLNTQVLRKKADKIPPTVHIFYRQLDFPSRVANEILKNEPKSYLTVA